MYLELLRAIGQRGRPDNESTLRNYETGDPEKDSIDGVI